MKITIWGINYAPELVGIGPYNSALCQFLEAQGHEVRMVTTFPYYPAWEKSHDDRGHFYRSDNVDGVNVQRCWHFVPKCPTALKRILHEGSFVLFSFLRLLFLPKPDVFVVISPPLLIGAAAWLLSWLKKAPFILHVQDLQPDAAVGMGMLKTGPLIRAFYRLEAFAYRKAARVSGISHGMVNAFKRKGVPKEKTLYFPNGVNRPSTVPSAGAFRKRLGLTSNQFVAVYSGNLGVKQGLDVLVDAARLVRNPQIRVVICGEGSRRATIERQVAAHKLSNVIMLPLQENGHYAEMLVDADLSLITQQKDSGTSFFPSKLLSCLAFSKPILTVADESSELTAALKSGRFGLNVPPGNPQAVAGALETLADSPAERLEFAKAGTRFVEQFDFQTVLKRFEHELISLVNGATISRAPQPLAPEKKTVVNELVGA
jgi:colanic acid biosynthesis glycosyl transferase WcaI